MRYSLLFFLFLKFRSSLEIYLTNSSNTINSRKEETNNPAIWTEGIWGPLLEDWVIGNHRVARVTQLIPIQMVSAQNTTEEINIVKEVQNEKESKIAHGIKIINTGNVTKKPQRQITETDMYLLGAIEKLVYRVDFMEKRLRRVEEMLYYTMAGNKVDQEPCPHNFNRAGENCYLFAGTAGRELDWKAASKQCKKFSAVLTELETIEENQDIITYIQNQEHLRGRDFWTGGLNPGLLWIWSNTARPVKGNSQNTEEFISGNGRCLRFAYNPATRSYAYKGSDCSARYSYICELSENTASNELRRLGRNQKILKDV